MPPNDSDTTDNLDALREQNRQNRQQDQASDDTDENLDRLREQNEQNRQSDATNVDGGDDPESDPNMEALREQNEQNRQTGTTESDAGGSKQNDAGREQTDTTDQKQDTSGGTSGGVDEFDGGAGSGTGPDMDAGGETSKQPGDLPEQYRDRARDLRERAASENDRYGAADIRVVKENDQLATRVKETARRRELREAGASGLQDFGPGDFRVIETDDGLQPQLDPEARARELREDVAEENNVALSAVSVGAPSLSEQAWGYDEDGSGTISNDEVQAAIEAGADQDVIDELSQAAQQGYDVSLSGRARRTLAARGSEGVAPGDVRLGESGDVGLTESFREEQTREAVAEAGGIGADRVDVVDEVAQSETGGEQIETSAGELPYAQERINSVREVDFQQLSPEARVKVYRALATGERDRVSLTPDGATGSAEDASATVLIDPGADATVFADAGEAATLSQTIAEANISDTGNAGLGGPNPAAWEGDQSVLAPAAGEQDLVEFVAREQGSFGVRVAPDAETAGTDVLDEMPSDASAGDLVSDPDISYQDRQDIYEGVASRVEDVQADDVTFEAEAGELSVGLDAEAEQRLGREDIVPENPQPAQDDSNIADADQNRQLRQAAAAELDGVSADELDVVATGSGAEIVGPGGETITSVGSGGGVAGRQVTDATFDGSRSVGDTAAGAGVTGGLEAARQQAREQLAGQSDRISESDVTTRVENGRVFATVDADAVGQPATERISDPSDVAAFGNQQLEQVQGPGAGDVRASVTRYGQRQLDSQDRAVGDTSAFEGTTPGAVDYALGATEDPRISNDLTDSGGFLAEEGDSGTFVTDVTGISEQDLREPADPVLAGVLPTREQLREGGASESALFAGNAEDPAGVAPSQEGLPERVLEGAGVAGASILNVRERAADAEQIIEGAQAIPREVREEGATATAETLTAIGRKEAADTAARAESSPARFGGGLALDVFGGAAAFGRVPDTGDLKAEVDPRVGMFGETLETKALRRFTEDDRGMADMSFGQRRSGDAETGSETISSDQIADVRATADPGGEIRITRATDDVSGGARSRVRAGLNEQGSFVGSNTHPRDAAFGGTGKPDTSGMDFSGVEFREIPRLRDDDADTGAATRRADAEQQSVDTTTAVDQRRLDAGVDTNVGMGALGLGAASNFGAPTISANVGGDLLDERGQVRDPETTPPGGVERTEDVTGIDGPTEIGQRTEPRGRTDTGSRGDQRADFDTRQDPITGERARTGFDTGFGVDTGLGVDVGQDTRVGQDVRIGQDVDLRQDLDTRQDLDQTRDFDTGDPVDPTRDEPVDPPTDLTRDPPTRTPPVEEPTDEFFFGSQFGFDEEAFENNVATPTGFFF